LAKACAERAPTELARTPVILVVDDDDSVRRLLDRGLKQHGFETRLAGDGLQALTVYRRHLGEIDLVLLDVQMPGLDGPQTLAALRRENPAVRCCFISGHSGTYSEEELLGLGALHYFRKPFLLGELAARLHELLDQGKRGHSSP